MAILAMLTDMSGQDTLYVVEKLELGLTKRSRL
jgi:hypothetical protein